MTPFNNKFDLSVLKGNKCILIIGKWEHGKSELCKTIMFHNRDVGYEMVVSGSEVFEKNFLDSMSPNVLTHFSRIENLIIRQAILIQKARTNIENLNTRAFLLVDSDTCNVDMIKQISTSRMIFQGSLYKILRIFLTEYPIDIPVLLRDKIDFVFILNDTDNRTKLYRDFAEKFVTFQEFDEQMNKYTRGNGCIVVDNNTKKLFWHKIQMPPPFKLLYSPEILPAIKETEAPKPIESKIDEITYDETFASKCCLPFHIKRQKKIITS